MRRASKFTCCRRVVGHGISLTLRKPVGTLWEGQGEMEWKKEVARDRNKNSHHGRYKQDDRQGGLNLVCSMRGALRTAVAHPKPGPKELRPQHICPYG